jgi:hypothetical protein
MFLKVPRSPVPTLKFGLEIYLLASRATRAGWGSSGQLGQLAELGPSSGQARAKPEQNFNRGYLPKFTSLAGRSLPRQLT